jgi:hypothetical protein
MFYVRANGISPGVAINSHDVGLELRRCTAESETEFGKDFPLFLLSFPFLSPPPFIMSDQLRYLGQMAGHKGWVTAIATSSENPDMILTASRGEYFILSQTPVLTVQRQDNHCLATHPQ